MEKTSKKAKITIIILIVAILVVGLSLGAFFLVKSLNKKTEKQKLQTPVVNFESNDSGKFIVANNNLLASSYSFFIYSGDEPDEVYDYIRFDSNKYYLNVSDIFVEAKDYYYYCKCIGSENYEDSDISEVKKFTNMHQLTTPNLAISGTEISWTRVSNATLYKVYDDNNEIARLTTTSYDFSQYILTKQKTTFSFSVRAVAGENYFESARSNSVTYTKVYTLRAPQNLTFNAVDKVLYWDSVSNATSYTIELGDGTILTSKASAINLGEIVVDVGTYTFKVKAIGGGNYRDSEYSKSVSYTQTQKLKSVTNLSYIKLNDNQIGIMWEADSSALTFTLKINGENVDVALSSNGYILNLDENVSSYNIVVIVNGYGYYDSSNPVSITINL